MRYKFIRGSILFKSKEREILGLDGKGVWTGSR